MDSPKIFDRTGSRRPKMSAFDLSREQKLTGRMGDLIPTLIEEIVPGDSFKVKTESLVRLAPMYAPLMHRVNIFMHYFFVPNRLLWPEWETFITGGRLGTSQPAYPETSFINISAPETGLRLADYLGLPTPSVINSSLPKVSSLPFRAYQLIWNEYYRDETLNVPVDILNESSNLYVLRKRAWEKDYFTSALPWTQRGDEVGIPIEGGLNVNYREQAQVTYPDQVAPPGNFVGRGALGLVGTDDGSESIPIGIDNIESLEGDTLDFSINTLRSVSAIQRFLEKQARGGYRYIETLLSHFGVKSDDARLQRPEYLGGGKQPIVISEVLNTTSGSPESPQGDMAGHGISSGVTNSFSKRFNEHGYVIGIMSIMPRSSYQQGLPRHWSRRNKYDYYWPEFANIGEQEIKNKEIYMRANAASTNEEAFGYQQRYAEYKYGVSSVHGEFRNSLSYWHLGRIFATPPSLNASFIEANVDTDRIFPVEDQDHLWIQLYHDVKARRPMPYFANPSLR